MAEGQPPFKQNLNRKTSNQLKPIRDKKDSKVKSTLRPQKNTGVSSSVRKVSGSIKVKKRASRVGGTVVMKSVGLERKRLESAKFKVVMPIWMKFAGFTCALLSIFLIIFGVILSNVTEKEMNDQINLTGKKLATLLASSIGAFWEDTENPEKEAKKVEERLKNYKAKDKDIQEILFIEIKDNGKKDLRATARPGGNQIILDYEPVTIAEGIKETTIEGNLTRVFSVDITKEDKVVGIAQVYLKAQKIKEVKESLTRSIIMVCALGILLGAILTFLIVKLMTKPIQILVEDIRMVSSGDLAHQTLPRSRDEIGELASTFNEMTQKLRLAKEEELKKRAMENELEIATEIQTKLLPERLPQIPGYDIAVYYLSAKHVGGDYYDFIVVDPRHLGIVVADVSGKGIPGSMVMTMARSLIRLASRGNTSPSDTMRKVNKILAQDMRRGMFVTADYMVLNVQDRILTVSSAGHNPLVIYRAHTKSVELVKPKGIALGFDKGSIFDSNIEEKQVQLYKGDRIVSYTDGVVEAMNHKDEEFGDDTFYELTKQHGHISSKEYIKIIVKALEKHRGKAEQSDDITISTILIE